MRWGIAVLAAALLALGLGASSAPAATGSGGSGAAADDDVVYVTSSAFTPFRRPGEREVKARASIAPGVFAAAVAVRAVTALRAARIAAAVRAAQLARQASANVLKVKKSRLARSLKVIRKIPRNKKGFKKAWKGLDYYVRSCIATSVWSKTSNWLIDGKIELREWNEYAAWGPRLVPPTESLRINFPIVIRDEDSPGQILREEVINCVIGHGVSEWIQEGTLQPR